MLQSPRNLAQHTGDRLQEGVQLEKGRDEMPEYFDTLPEYVEFCVDYRSKLAQVIKLTASWLPQQARSALCPFPHPFVLLFCPTSCSRSDAAAVL